MTRVLLAEIMHETNTFNRIATVKAEIDRHPHVVAGIGKRSMDCLAVADRHIPGFTDQR